MTEQEGIFPLFVSGLVSIKYIKSTQKSSPEYDSAVNNTDQQTLILHYNVKLIRKKKKRKKQTFHHKGHLTLEEH